MQRLATITSSLVSQHMLAHAQQSAYCRYLARPFAVSFPARRHNLPQVVVAKKARGVIDTLAQSTAATIVFADIAESVRIVEAGGQPAVERMRALLSKVAQDAVPLHGGRLVQRMGDGLMLEFTHPRAAAGFAFAAHTLAAELACSLPQHEQLLFHIGIHTADVLHDDTYVYGHGVNLAARIAGIANAGETIASVASRDQLVADLDAAVEDLGECYLKHVASPVRLYRLLSPTNPPVAGARHAAGAHGRPCIAVLAPRMRAGDEDCAAIGQVVADDLTSALSRSPHLMVISRLSANAFLGRDMRAAEICAMLGADYLATGSYRVSASKVVLTLELIRASDEVMIWVDSLTLSVDKIWLGEPQLSHGIAMQISAAVLEAEIELVRNHALPSVKDYSLLLGAIGLMFRTQRSDFERSRAALDHLIERHPRRAAPYSWLAKWHVFRVTQGWFNSLEEEAGRAMDCVNRALDLQPGETTALTVSGLVHTNLRKNAAQGLSDYDAALAANPNNALAWLYRGTALAFVGDGQEALASAEHALKLSPFDPWQYYFESLGATAALAAGDWPRAIELGKRSYRSNALHLSTLRAIAIAQAMSGAQEAARITITTIRQRDPTWSVGNFLARSPSGNTDRGRRWAEALAAAGLPQTA